MINEASLLVSEPRHMECLDLIEEIVDGLDDRGILELSGGYKWDVDKVFDALLQDTYDVLYTGKDKIDLVPKYTTLLSESIEERFREHSLNYFITSVISDFQLSTHHLEWGELTGLHKKLGVIAARDHGKSYYFSNAYPAWQLYKYKSSIGNRTSRPSKFTSNRGYLFSFSLQQSVDLIEILKGTIEGNEILRERLYPSSRTQGAWASTNIMCKNGARLTGKGFGSSVRGAHPYWIIVDDGLKDNVIYSALQRQKSIDYFHSVIMNMLTPDGQIVVVGTPFHAQDLYGDLKTKKGWFIIEYPALFPDGTVLWPGRWNFDSLIEKRNTQGSLIFSRENLCRPITNESSIFPMSILNRCINGMENYTLVRNRGDFPKKFDKVVVGCDFAISANVGADYTVFSVFGVEDDGTMWLLYMFREKGKTYEEQMQALRGINVRFRPNVMVLEQNVFQQIFVQESDKQGLPVVGHSTGAEKNTLDKGWPMIAVNMERGKVRIPIGDKFSQDVKDIIFTDLGSVAFTDKGLQSVGANDDISSSFWLATLGRNIATTGFKFMFL